MPTTTAQAVAIVGGSVLSGAMLSICGITVPVLLETTTDASQLAQQWRHVYTRGMSLAPPFALSTLLLYGYTAYRRRSAGRPWAAFAAAGALTIGIIPFTAVFLAPISNRLLAIAAQASVSSTGIDEVKALVGRWNQVHFLRSLLPLAGAVVGAVATFGGY